MPRRLTVDFLRLRLSKSTLDLRRGGSLVAADTVPGVGVLGWILLGLFAGAIARAIAPGRGPGGCIGTTAIGVLGALIGGAIASALEIGEIEEFFDLGTWLIAIGGSVLLLLAIGALSRR